MEPKRWKSCQRHCCRTHSIALAPAEEEIDVCRPLHTYGVDLLLALELRNWFAKVFRANVAVLDITGQRSIEALVRHTVERIEPGMKRKAQASRLIARGQSAEFGLCKSSVYT